MNKGSIVERLCSDLIAKSRDINGLFYFLLYINPSRLLRMSVTVSVAVSKVGMTELIFVNPVVKGMASITAMSCSLSRCFQSSNQTCRRAAFIHKTICCLRRNWSFFCVL